MSRTKLWIRLAVGAALITVPGCLDDTLTREPLAPSVPARATVSRVLWDDFSDGFSVNVPDAKWFYFAAGPYVGDDGIVTTAQNGLRVTSSGVNPATGEPAFVRTLGLESVNGGLPGGLDHVKWLAYMNHLSSHGYPGFDAVMGEELTCEATLSGRTYGTGGHPFGGAVSNPNDDIRLAGVAMNTIDFETFLVADFFLSNERVYVLYERLPFLKGAPGFGNYASFTYAIPVAKRKLGTDHSMKIAYDRAAGTIRWLLDDREVYRVDRIGYRIDRRHMLLDHGGEDTLISPRQLACGMGMFTLLDAVLPGSTGLVRLSEAPGFYFSPRLGEPAPAEFVDASSADHSRLFGQGAELRVRKYGVSTRRTGRD